ncbi:hypothetical protein [Polyangium aurulentum]|uniref:hypothetical protein n=1 Tax=Polyangium aurulentum TaxID=2567896 RepID=UPI0010ADFC7D|nr:hypothetical protein [Polyangium aurulentum]UQA60197.1 hypothetical protein E8A73_006875 [Polyangium aurulentum]
MRATINGRTAARTSFVAALLMVFGPGCAGSDGEAGERTGENAEALNGPVSFLSADDFPEVYGEEEEEEEEDEGASSAKSLVEDDREIGKGDIYRVLGDGFLLNLNVYRGLQVIDINNPAAPAIVARLPLNGTPFDVHVRNDRAVVLVNDWYGYKADANRIAAQRFTGGALLEIDITNRAAPQLVAEHHVPGEIRAAERYSDAAADTLYIATIQQGAYVKPDGGQIDRYGTALQSFELTSSALVAKGELLLDRYVRFMAASSTGLLVASGQHPSSSPNQVSIVDISGPNGAMTMRGSVTSVTDLRSPLHMDLRNNQLRILTGPSYSTTSRPNRLRTWNVSNPDSPVAVDSEDLSNQRVLNGVAFLDDRVFVTTSYGVDNTFHALSIDPSGNIDEKNESTVADEVRNFHPRSVFGGSRVLGVGFDGMHFGVSLYDAVNLTNPNPVIARAKTAVITNAASGNVGTMDSSWYSLLENAVNVQAPTGETETGLVLLPVTGSIEVNGEYVQTSGVQVFTFSSTTVTSRGFMSHPDSEISRTFRAGASTGVSLSDTELGLHDLTNPDNPAKDGYLALAPENLALLRFGNHRVRVRRTEERGNPIVSGKPAVAEIIPAVANAETAAPLASIEVKTSANYTKVGNLLVVSWPRRNPSQFDVYDFSDPLHPQSVGTTSVSMPSLDWNEKLFIHATNGSLALVRTKEVEAALGSYAGCAWRPLEDSSSCNGQEGCTYWVGDRACRTPDGGQEYCSGGFSQCTDHVGADPTCVPVPLAQAEPYIIGGCDYGYALRSYKLFTVRVLDLSNPASPNLLPPITLPSGEEAVSSLSDGHDLFLTIKEPAVSPTDPRPHAKYSIRRLDLSQPSQPALGAPINVPGELLSVDGDVIFTRDRVWGDFTLPDTAVAKLKLKNGLAVLKNYERFSDREVASVVMDDHRAVVTHSLPRKPYWWQFLGNGWDSRPKVTILKPEAGIGVNGFNVLGDKPIQPWMNLFGAAEQRLFFAVPGGTLIVNADKPKKLKPQAFLFASNLLLEIEQSPLPSIEGNELLLTVGRIGIHQLDLTSSNLP